MSHRSTVPLSWRLAGFPLSAWTFALRTWGAMMLALLVAFWLQLDGAATAATTVGILSLQTRGQALQKAMYRTIGTSVGLTMSIILAGVFDQTRYVFLFTCSLWLGVCATAAGLLSGSRAYGAILSGYTVAIVALPNVDTPSGTFASAVNRGAAITVGIVCMTLVSDLAYAPNLLPGIVKRLEHALESVRSFALDALRDGGAEALDVAVIDRSLTAFHPDVTALASESISGRARYEACCMALVSLLRTVSAARVASFALSALGGMGAEPRENLVRAIEEREHESVQRRAIHVLSMSGTRPERLIAASACLVLFEQYQQALVAITGVRDGRRVARTPRLALYRSGHAAVRTGARVSLVLAITSYVLSILDWPGSTTALVQIGSIAGLSAIAPDPRKLAWSALFAMPLAAAAAGITEFLVLDGADDFELLALGMGPAVILTCLVLSAGRPAFSTASFLVLVYFPVLLAPANPQSYDPQRWLFDSFLTILAMIALYVLLSTLLPAGALRQRAWMLASARADLKAALFGSSRRFDAPACAFRDADRIGQFAALLTSSEDGSADLRQLIRMSDLAACFRRIRAALDPDPALPEARATLATLDAVRIRRLGQEMLLASEDGMANSHVVQRRAAIDLLQAAVLIETSPGIVAMLGRNGV